jgi:hypothetical protein
MVQLSRSKILVREMDFHKMCNKSMEKVREFCTKQAHKCFYPRQGSKRVFGK